MNCAPEAWFYIKPTTNPTVTESIAPAPFAGINMLLIPIHNVYAPVKIKSFVYTMLTCPLVIGKKYKLTFYINTARRRFSYLDILFSDMEPANGKFRFDSLIPTLTIESSSVVKDEDEGWKFVDLEFVAKSNAKFCMLGDMSAKMEYLVRDRMNRLGTVFYFIDQLKLIPVGELIPCNLYEENIKKTYEQNSRHTEQRLVDVEGAKPKRPLFIMDTVNIPAAYFENNSSLIKPRFKKTIDSIALSFSFKKVSKIEISGHTDSIGTMEKNEILSLARAVALKDHLIRTYPAISDIMFVSGKGYSRPIASNATEFTRAQNRRVEIILTLQKTVE